MSTGNDHPNQEIEAKFRITDDAVFERFASASTLAQDFTTGDASVKSHSDTYFDTDEYMLLRAGVALRVRRDESTSRVTIKSAGDSSDSPVSSVFQRAELECDVDPSLDHAPHLSQVSPEMRQLLQKHNPQNLPLQPVLTLAQRRTKRDVFASDERLAELSLDNVWVYPSNTSSYEANAIEHKSALAQFQELELELLPEGELALLQQLTKLIEQESGIARSTMSKLETGLTALGVNLD